MFRGFMPADEDHWNVPAVALFENGILIDIHFIESGTEFAQQGRDGRLSFFAKMATWPGV